MLQMTVSVDPLTDSNCYILYEKCKECPAEGKPSVKEGACVVIDPGESEELFRILEERRLEPELILLTHEHCDHMAGLDALRDRFPGAHFPAAAACDAGIRDTRLNMSRIMDAFLYFKGKPDVQYDPFKCRPADEIIPDDAILTWRGHTFRFVPLPGHTPGSEGIFLDEDVFFSGDYLIPGEEDIVRLPGGNEEDYKSITAPYLAALPKGLKVCPGHGGSFTL